MRAIIVRCWRALRKLDNRDVHVYGGLAIVGVGGFFLSAAWTCIAIGSVLVAFGLFGGLLDRLVTRLTEDRG